MSKLNLEKLFEFSDMPPKVKQHLNKVYGTLSISCMSAVASCLIMPVALVNNFAFNILSVIATIGLLITMYFNKGNQNHGTKFLCLVAIALIDGAQLKPLVAYAGEIDPMIVVNALIYTASIFISFTLLSLKTERRSMLFLGGIISSVMMGMLFGSIFSLITGVGFISYLGYNIIMLGVFSLYVIYDTQMIIEKAHMNDFDYTFHALELFIDLVEIFVRILRILIALSKEKKDD